MKQLVAVIAVTVAAGAGAEPLMQCGTDLAFRPEAVDGFAARAYRETVDGYASSERLDRDPVLLARLHRIVAHLARAARSDEDDHGTTRWEIHTCRRCGENASAMAGGRLMVGEEFIARLAPTDDELGFLLAHEMAHVLCEHTREFATVARYFEDNGLHREYWDIQRELDGSLGLQYRMAFVAAQQELEADRVGFFLGARAGLEPRAMLSLLARLDPPAQSSAAPAMHPDIARRLEQAKAMLEAAQVVYSRSRAGPHMFRKRAM